MILIVDPMLATGGSADAAVQFVKKKDIYNKMIEKYSDSLKKLEKKYEISIEITKTESINQKGEKIIYK